MKSFTQYNEGLIFEENQGRNITVGAYDTDNFDLCPGAVEAFENLMQEKDIDMAKVQQAAEHVDRALGVERVAVERGFSTRMDLERYDEHAAAAEEILEELGDLENHQHYLRDVHEVALVDMLDIDTEITDDHLDNLSSLEQENDDVQLDEEVEDWEYDDNIENLDFEDSDFDNIFDE